MIEDLVKRAAKLTVPQWFGTAVASLYIWGWVIEFHRARRIAQLGQRTARATSWVPLGLDFVWKAVKYATANKNAEFWEEAFAKAGNPANPWNLEADVAGRRAIFTADPENIKAILATQFQDYGKGEQFNKEWHAFLGNSIFTTDHDRWHESRQLIRPQFIKDRLSDLDTFEKHFEILVTKLGGNGQTIDICDLFFRYTLDAALDFLLGSNINSLENPDAAFAAAFGEVQHDQSVMARMGPLQKLYPKGRYRKGIKVINNFVNPFIDQVLRYTPEELEAFGKGDEGYTFLHALAGYTRDRTVLRDQLVAVLLAGRDTTACTLSWFFYEISKQPRIVQKLRDEIENQCGFERRPEYSDLKEMKYLQWALNETLRLYPVVPFNVRESIKDTTLPTGGGPRGDQPIGILKGTPIGYSTFLMQRRPDLYPPVSEGFAPIDDFVPERWDGWNPKHWTYIPFNGGPRLCVGQQFALTEMGYTVTRILQRFGKVETRQNGVFPGMQSDIVLQPANGVKLAFYDK